MHDLTGFQRDLLFVIAGMDSPSGREVKTKFEQSVGEGVLFGQVYSNLDALVEDGFIEKGEQDGRTNEYEITKQGERAISARYEWQRRHISADCASAE